MKKNNVKIKDNITSVDEITAIKSMASYYFTDGEYTPYYSEIAKITVVAQNFLEGVEFDENDYVYECVLENEDLYKCVNKFLTPSINKSDAQHFNRMERIMKQVEDMVEFEKQKIIHNADAFSVVGDMCIAIKNLLDSYVINAELAQGFMEDLKESGITEETLANAVRRAANQFKMPDNEMIESQRQRIAEQQEQLQEKETEIQDLRKWKREYMVRNVKAVKGSGEIANSTNGKMSK